MWEHITIYVILEIKNIMGVSFNEQVTSIILKN